MPNFARRVLPALGLVAPACIPFAWNTPYLPAALAATAASHAVLLYGTLRPNQQMFGPVVTGFVPRGPEVWLTVDDGPDPEDTPRLLDLLDAAGARATFFVVGQRARAHPDLVREIAWRGHGVGNHTDTHPQATFWGLGPRRLKREIGGCQRTLEGILDAAPRWFRAPVGMVNPFVHAAAEACGLRLVGWSARGFDGVSHRAADPAAVARRVLSTLHPGGIALLHEGRRGAAGERVNVLAMARLLAVLKERGWRAVLPEVL